MKSINIGVVAGETSGDNLGAGLIEALQSRFDQVNVRGIAGPRMQALGARSFHEMDSISVMGLDGLVKELPSILRIRRNLIEDFKHDPPDVFVGIDVPDFNIGVELKLKSAGIPTVHYVSPTVWAWRGYRIKKIKQAVSHMLTLFPFEEQYYQRHEVPVTFVGHPMADEISGSEDGALLRQELSLTNSGTTIAMLPGSRVSEVSRLAPEFLRAARIIRQTRPDAKFLIPFATGKVRSAFEKLVSDHDLSVDGVHTVDGRAREVMAASDVVLLASGTAALEAALLRKPMVATYKMSALSAAMVRRFSHTDYYCMPNHLLSTPRVPELMQEDATPEKMATQVLAWLEDPSLMDSLKLEFAQIHESLKQDASERAADAIVSVLSA